LVTVICGPRGEDALGLGEDDRGGGGVNTAILSSLCFSCLAFSALSATSAIIPIVTNIEKTTASIEGITIMTNFPEFKVQGMGYIL
jgi:hypothetical protein